MTINPQIGGEYLYKHYSGNVNVRVVRQYSTKVNNHTNRWVLLNLKTNREIVAKSRRKFLSVINQPSKGD